MSEQPAQFRIGQGYDIHRLVGGRALWLGGVEVPSSLGLLGHSDGDVVLHAICDAILGALAAGDIGGHFPDTDPSFKGSASSELLRKVVSEMCGRGYRVGNVDVTIIAEKPKIAPHREAIRRRIAELTGAACETVSVKAKTNEGLDAIGRGEAMAAWAIVLLTSGR